MSLPTLTYSRGEKREMAKEDKEEFGVWSYLLYLVVSVFIFSF